MERFKCMSFAIALGCIVAGGLPTFAGPNRMMHQKVIQMSAENQEGETPPFYESFNDDSFLNSWTQINNNSISWYWKKNGGLDYSGSAALNQSQGPKDVACDNWLISPPLNLKKGMTYRTSFYVTNWFNASLHLYLLKSPTDTSDKTKLIDYTGDEWDTYKKEFEVPTDGKYYFAFHDDSPYQTNSTELTYQVFIDEFRVEAVSNNATPETVANLKPVPGAQGEVSMGLSWICPTKSKGGENLDAISYIKIYKDKENAVTITEGVAPGAKMTWTDPEPSEGKHTYRVVVANASGESESATVNTFVGIDYAGAPQNVSLDYDKEGDVVNLEWEAPEFGGRGGWFDTTGLRYRMVRQPGGKVLTNNLTDTQFEDDSFDGYANYYYQITAVTDAGVGGTATTDCVVIGSSATLPIREGWEDKTTFSTWTIADNNNDGHTWTFNGYRGNGSPGCIGYDYTQTSVAKDETLYSAPIELSAGKEYKVTFDVLNTPMNSFSLNVAYGKAATMNAQTNSLITMSDKTSDSWSTVSQTFKPAESGIYYVSFWLHDTPSSFFYMDNIRIEQVLRSNIEATSVRNMNTDPTAGQKLSTGVTYTNTGTGKSASKFTVQLIDDADNVLGYTTVNRAMAAEASATANITWTAPKESGRFAVRGRVVMDGDECESDNTTAQSWLNIQPNGTKAVTIGSSSDVSGSIPFADLGYTFFETIYHGKDLQNMAGNIDSLAIKVRMGQSRDYLNIPFRVYLGATDRTDMNKGWIPVDENMTEVFNGTLDFKRGSYELVIPFKEPFTYSGGNLALLIVGDHDGHIFLNDGDGIGTYVTEYGIGASRKITYLDDKPDPTNPDNSIGNFFSTIPNTVFFFDHSKTGTVTGKVSDSEGNGISGITVKQMEYDGKLSTVTDENGNYTFPYFPAGDAVLKTSGSGYAEQFGEGEVVAGETANIDIEGVEQAMPISVNGVVCDKIDSSKGIAGATVVFKGDNVLTATTDDDGNFSIDGIYEELPYTVVVKAPDYETTSFSDEMFYEDDEAKYSLAPSTAAPCNVKAIDNGETASVTWKEALQPISASKAADNYAGLFGGSTDKLTIGQRYTASELKALGVDSDYYLTALRYVPMCTGTFTLNIWQGETGNEALVYEESFNPTSYEEWNTYKLKKAYKIDPTKDLVFGYSVVAGLGSYPVGFDAGPAIEGGDVIYDNVNRKWTSAHEELPDQMNYNWSIAAVFGSNTNSAPVEWASTENSNKLNALSELKANRMAMTTNAKVSSSIIPATQKYESTAIVDYQIKMLPKTVAAISAPAKAPVRKKPLGYNIYRLECGQEDSAENWTKLNSETLTSTEFTDDKWTTVENKPYRFAVRATYGTPKRGSEIESEPTFSDGVDKGRYATVNVTIATDKGNAESAEVKLYNNEGTMTQIAGTDGKATFSNVHFGQYTLQVLKPYYKRYAETVKIDENSQELTANVAFAATPVPQLDATDYIHETRLAWEAPSSAFTDKLIKCHEHSQNISFKSEDPILVGAHFDAEDLKAYDYTNFYIDSISFRAGADLTYNVQLWSGLEGQEVVVWNKDVDVEKGDRWVSVALDSPVKLDPSKSYYIAYEVTPETDKYPFGVDDGPLTKGGGMMYGYTYQSNSYTWYSLAYGINFEISAHLTTVPDRTKEDHSAVTYQLYRLKSNDSSSEENWTLVTKDALSEQSYNDKTWEQIADADYKYAAKSIYFGNVSSEPTFSKILPKGKVSLATFQVTTNNGLGAAGATVTINTTDKQYTGKVGDDNKAIIPEITKGNAYEITVAKEGYDTLFVTKDFNESEITINLQLAETKLAPVMVLAKAAADNSNVKVTWRTPGSYAPHQGWAYWDNGTAYAGYGSSTGSGSIAQLYTPEDQIAKGMKELYVKKISFFPTDYSDSPVSAGAKWTVKVWRQIDDDNFEEVASQKAEDVKMNQWNEVEFSSPYYISGDETLLLGYTFVGSGSVFGIDNGPCVKGKGDWANFGQGWTQVHSASSSFDYNNLIHTYCEAIDGDAPEKAPALAASEPRGNSLKGLKMTRSTSVKAQPANHTPLQAPSVAVKGYQVYRLASGQENNPSAWTKLASTSASETTYTDNGWGSLDKKNLNYRWAVKTIYASGNSEAEYSNILAPDGTSDINTVESQDVVIKQTSDGKFNVTVPEACHLTVANVAGQLLYDGVLTSGTNIVCLQGNDDVYIFRIRGNNIDYKGKLTNK